MSSGVTRAAHSRLSAHSLSHARSSRVGSGEKICARLSRPSSVNGSCHCSLRRSTFMRTNINGAVDRCHFPSDQTLMRMHCGYTCLNVVILNLVFNVLRMDLRGHLKSGHAWSVQNRPCTKAVRDEIVLLCRLLRKQVCFC